MAGAIAGSIVAMIVVYFLDRRRWLLFKKRIPKTDMKLGHILLLVFAICLFMVGAWQLDLVVAPLLWGGECELCGINYVREVLPWIHLPNQTFYVICYIAQIFSVILTIIAVYKLAGHRTRERLLRTIAIARGQNRSIESCANKQTRDEANA